MTGALLLLSRRGRLDNVRLLLLGVAIGICGSAVTTWLLYFSNDQSLREIMFWMMGSPHGLQSKQPAWWWVPYLAVMGWLLMRREALSLLQLGDAQAQLMGLDLQRLRWQLVLAVYLSAQRVGGGYGGLHGFHWAVDPASDATAGGTQWCPLCIECILASGARHCLLADLLSRNILPER